MLLGLFTNIAYYYLNDPEDNGCYNSLREFSFAINLCYIHFPKHTSGNEGLFPLDKNDGNVAMNVLTLGTCCVDVYPEKAMITPGGEALNIAAQLSHREDVNVYIMGMIGIDEYADFLNSSISCLAINKDYLYQTEGKTANQIIKITADGDRYFEEGSWDSGVSALFKVSSDDEVLLDTIDIVYTTLWEPNLPELVRLKKEKGFKLAVDFDIQRDFSQWSDIIDELDIFHISGDENLGRELLSKSESSDTMFVMTLAEQGSRVYYKGEMYSCDAFAVEQVEDTTGCGDCYLGNFGVEFLKTGNIHQSMEIASREASNVTAHVGGFVSLIPNLALNH